MKTAAQSREIAEQKADLASIIAVADPVLILESLVNGLIARPDLEPSILEHYAQRLSRAAWERTDPATGLAKKMPLTEK